MADSSSDAILKTLLYAEIFDFPLKKKEIYSYLISPKKISLARVLRDLNYLKNKISLDGDYLFINNKKSLVLKRIEREEISKNKMVFAINVIKKLAFIPTVKFVGISGALAMRNCEEEDDIDLFVITEENTVWFSRLFLILYLKFLRVYRGKKEKNVKNKICLNMMVDEKQMSFKDNDKNLYTAHEIIQLIPVLDKKNTYQKFIKQNSWIYELLANYKFDKKIYFKSKNNFLDESFVLLLKNSSIEHVSEIVQKKYMNEFITKEIIRDGFLAFHPFDYKQFALREYNKKLRKFNLI